MTNKKVKILKIIAFVFFSVLVISMSFALNSCFLVETPDVQYHEFPMEITYEINGEIVEQEGIYVIEYSGVDLELGHRYDGYIKSTGEDGFILYEEDRIKVLCKLGDAYYYTGLIKYENGVEARAYRKEESFWDGEQYYILDETELYEQYGIKIISWTTSEPLDDIWD